jgi:hypothetical protein
MRGVLKERQDATRRRHAPEPPKVVPARRPVPAAPIEVPCINLSQARYRIEEEAGLYVVRDGMSGLIISYSTKEKGAHRVAKRLNGLVKTQALETQAEINALKLSKPKTRETHGTRWSKFGTVNADIASPTRNSIRDWGLKIKARQNPPSD